MDEKTKLSRAFAACGAARWTPQLLVAMPIDTLCDGRDKYDEGYTLCRMVQALGTKIMSNPKPE